MPNILSFDGIQFTLTPEEAKHSILFMKEMKNSGESCTIQITHPLITGSLLGHIVDRLKTGKCKTSSSLEIMLQIIIASDHLRIRKLYKHYRNFICDALNECKNPEEVRFRLNLPDDFDDKEREDIKKEDAYTWGQTDIWNSLNVSVLVDNKAPDANMGVSPENDVVRMVRKRKLSKPVEDHTVDSCFSCKTQFTLFNRKHHCRACGRIFCSACSSKNIEITSDKEIGYQQSSIFRYLYSDKNVRVCDACYNDLRERKMYTSVIEAFRVMALPIILLKRASTVCKAWRKAAIWSLSLLRELQYRLPTQEFTRTERDMLWNNRMYWSGHSQWIYQLLRVVNWKYESKVESLFQVLTGEKQYDCFSCMCGRRCKDELLSSECIILFSDKYRDKQIREYAAGILEKKYNSGEFINYLPFLVFNLRYSSDISDPLFKLLLLVSGNNMTICSMVYSLLCLYRESVDKSISNLYDYFLQQFLLNMSQSKDFLSKLSTSMYKTKIMALNIQSSSLKDILTVNDSIVSLTSPNVKLTGILTEGIQVKNSASKPSIVPFVTSTGDKYRLLFKKEDVRGDIIIFPIVRIMNNLLESSGISIPVITSPIIPLTKDSGIIEIIPDAETLYDILSKGTVSNYLFNNNKDKVVGDVMNRYIKSLAFWTVVTHLLGIGDRHTENIMIKKDGSLLHIDCGYVLGYESKILAPSIRMNQELIEGFGGRENYEMFKQLCGDIFLKLRKYSIPIFTMLTLLADMDPPMQGGKFTYKYLEEQLISRFYPGQNDKEAREYLYKLIDNCCDATMQKIGDCLHAYSKNSPTLNTIANGSKGILSWLTG